MWQESDFNLAGHIPGKVDYSILFRARLKREAEFAC
jgi:hypothetical protein